VVSFLNKVILKDFIPEPPQSVDRPNYGRPMEQGRQLHFALWFLSSFFHLLFLSPNLSGRRLDVYHTLTHDVALVRI